MLVISLKASSCVRSLSVESECKKCEVICPTNAIVVGENPLPVINHSMCVTCGACNAVCPNESFRYKDFNTTDFFFDFLEDEESNLISCKKNIPCIAALSVEHIISLTVFKKEIVFDMGHCEGCNIAHSCYPQILKNYEEASYLLEAMENKSLIKLENICFKPVDKSEDRRAFLSAFKPKTLGKIKRNFENEVKKASDELREYTLEKIDIMLLKKKLLPKKRKLFFSAIKRVIKPSQFHVVDATEVSFTSQKIIDEDSCTACQICYRVCPTGALTSDITNSKIDFDPFMCIKCNICHDVCEPNAITLSNSYNVKEFFKPEVQNLIEFNVLRCHECNMIFSTNGTEQICDRCKVNRLLA